MRILLHEFIQCACLAHIVHRFFPCVRNFKFELCQLSVLLCLAVLTKRKNFQFSWVKITERCFLADDKVFYTNRPMNYRKIEFSFLCGRGATMLRISCLVFRTTSSRFVKQRRMFVETAIFSRVVVLRSLQIIREQVHFPSDIIHAGNRYWHPGRLL